MKNTVTTLLIISFFLNSFILFSQENKQANHVLALEFVPLVSLDFVYPRHRIAIDYGYKKFNIALQFGYGNEKLTQVRMSLDNSIWTKNYKFFEFRPELKYSFYVQDWKRKTFKFYAALEFFNIKCTDEKSVETYISNESTAYFRKTKYGVNTKIGFQLITRRGFTFGPFIGLGLKHIKIQQYVFGPGNEYIFSNAQFTNNTILDDYDYPEVKTGLNLTLGVKVGIALLRMPKTKKSESEN